MMNQRFVAELLRVADTERSTGVLFSKDEGTGGVAGEGQSGRTEEDRGIYATIGLRLKARADRPNHFSYVYMDECGCATEPSTLDPIAGIISSSGKIDGSIVLSDDPKLLGPITRPEFAAHMGLNRLMLERLMNINVYQRFKLTGKYN